LKNNKEVKNFFEGMACQGGCLNGPLGLRHNTTVLANIDKFGERSHNKDPNQSVDNYKNSLK
jgi:iron only hydrogenase large subunit-like protein